MHTERVYQGKAELLDSEGRVIQEVDVGLRYVIGSRAKLGKWDGKIQTARLTSSNWMNTRRIRLPDGNIGNVHIEEVRVDGNTRTGQIIGSNYPPF